ncbi:hypothetical protein AVEN_77835-1 [Araneus ventricosus]|uniref:Uncharacterized protein n=1 Tax=Araneus ventricosus TaxID=182803 RepID=A0A4Y2GPU8_ARAVE|nr:hypothetical protein AVEN_77835-1 [Araneus ventricosus]
MVSVSASELGGSEFYPGLCSYSVFAIICNEFARQACGKLAASSFHGDFKAFVNLLQACTLVMTNLWQACCKLKLLSGIVVYGEYQISDEAGSASRDEEIFGERTRENRKRDEIWTRRNEESDPIIRRESSRRN